MIALRNSIWTLLIGVSLILCACGGGGGGSSDGSSNQSAPTLAETSFTFVALQSLLTGAFSAGVDINNNSTAVGLADDGSRVQGVRWDVTAPTTSPTILEPLTGNSYSAAYAINDAGISVGESENGTTTSAVFWPEATAVASALPQDGLFSGGASTAYGINAIGQIVGEVVKDVAGNTAAVVWQNSTTNPLLLANLGIIPESYSSAYAISDAGIIVGESLDDNRAVQAVTWLPNGSGGYSLPVTLPAPTNHVSALALNIDEDGRVVGESEEIDGVVHGLIWTLNNQGAVTNLVDIGPATSAADINRAGRVAGYTIEAGINECANVWNGLAIEEQKELAPNFSHSYGINNASQIVGIADGEGFVALPQ